MGKNRVFVLLCLILVSAFESKAQTGDRSFTFLDVPSFARITAMGGYLVSQPDADVALVLTNPAQSGDSLDNVLSISYLDYLGDVNKVQMAYQHTFPKLGTWFFAVDHIGYGKIEGYDDTGQSTLEYNAGETMVMVGTSHNIGLFRLGGSLKFITSDVAGFGATAMALDLGGTFSHPDKDLAFGLVFKNLGAVISDYDEGSSSELPFDVQAGVSFKPDFMPLRFHLTVFDLVEWDLPDGLEDVATGGKVLRHLNIGTEILIHRNFQVRLGYNHGRRQDLRLDNTGGGAGFSYGFVFFMKSFSMAYSRGGYHAAGGSNNFTLTIDTDSIFRKKIKL